MGTIFNGLKRLNSANMTNLTACIFYSCGTILSVTLNYFVFSLLISKKKLPVTCWVWNAVIFRPSSYIVWIWFHRLYFSIAEIFDLQWFWQEAHAESELGACKIKGIKRLGWQWTHHALPMNTAGWVNAMRGSQLITDAETNRWQNIYLRFCLWFTCSSPTSQTAA